MKATITISFVLLCALNSFEQVESTTELNQNNVNASLSDGGIFFNETSTSSPGYEVPAESGKHAIYSTAFWYGGEDVNGQLKLAAQTYTPESDLWSGPLSIGPAIAVTDGSWNPGLFTVTKAEIDAFKENFEDPSPDYEMSDNILSWPTHGDVAAGHDFYLAPFVDVDGDGLYDPLGSGDYPCIPGDRATFLIMNDKRDIHASGADPIGLEIHYLFYQYDQEDLKDVTFLNMRLINRGTQTLFGFKTTVFVDFDLGESSDDYGGTNGDKNLAFGYNGDMTDLVYDEVPPTIGVVSLNKEATSAGILSGSFGYSVPTNPAEFYNLMRGYSTAGAPWIDPETGETTQFMYGGNPATLDGPSELAVGNLPGDRSLFLTAGNEETNTLTPNEEQVYDYAFLFEDAGEDAFDNVNELFDLTDYVQDFYNTNGVTCYGGVAGIDETLTEAPQVSIFPNPSSNGQFNILLPTTEEQLEIKIMDMSGRTVYNTTTLTPNKQLQLTLEEAKGTYVIQIKTDTYTNQQLISIQ